MKRIKNPLITATVVLSTLLLPSYEVITLATESNNTAELKDTCFIGEGKEIDVCDTSTPNENCDLLVPQDPLCELSEIGGGGGASLSGGGLDIALLAPLLALPLLTLGGGRDSKPSTKPRPALPVLTEVPVVVIPEVPISPKEPEAPVIPIDPQTPQSPQLPKETIPEPSTIIGSLAIGTGILIKKAKAKREKNANK